MKPPIPPYEAPRPDLPDVLDTLTRLVAMVPESTQTLLIHCQWCRNHLLYILDRPGGLDHHYRVIAARLRALPEVHRRHRDPDSPDQDPPQISGVTTAPKQLLAPEAAAVIPLADDDSEPAADAAQQRADLTERAEAWNSQDGVL